MNAVIIRKLTILDLISIPRIVKHVKKKLLNTPIKSCFRVILLVIIFDKNGDDLYNISSDLKDTGGMKI